MSDQLDEPIVPPLQVEAIAYGPDGREVHATSTVPRDHPAYELLTSGPKGWANDAVPFGEHFRPPDPPLRHKRRYPEGRPGWLGEYQTWPCGRCGTDQDDSAPHECIPLPSVHGKITEV